MLWIICSSLGIMDFGFFRSYVRFDIIRRILTKVFGKEVVMVMGITDIDDKIIKRANEVSTVLAVLFLNFVYHVNSI